MGVERAVTLWYIYQQRILDEISLLEAQLDSAHSTPVASESSSVDEQTVPLVLAEPEDEQVLVVRERLAGVRKKLRALGPCPKPMMG